METIEEMGYHCKLTKNENTAFEFIVNHKPRACFMTSNEIADAAGISDSSVIRMAKKLGFESFAAFKKALQCEAAWRREKEEQSNVPYEDIRRNGELTGETLVLATRQNVMRNLEKDFSLNEPDKYLETVEAINRARNIYIAGFRTCSGLAGHFGALLSLVLPNVRIVNETGNAVDTLMDLDKKDVLLLISYSRYSKNALMTMKIARNAGCRILLITDKAHSPLTMGAHKVIVNSTGGLSFCNTYVSLMYTLEVLINLIANTNRQEGEKRLVKIDRYLEETGQY